jgi:hypothetical protein
MLTNKKYICLLALTVTLLAHVAFAHMRLHSSFSVAGTPMSTKANEVATGFSLGQSSVSILKTYSSSSNTHVQAGLWNTYWLLKPPPPPRIILPVYVEEGTTGYLETVEESIQIVGHIKPDNVYRFSSVTYSDSDETIYIDTRSNTFIQSLLLTPGDTYTYAYYNGCSQHFPYIIGI